MSLESSNSSNPSIEELLKRFSTGSSRQRKALVKSVELRAEEISSLGSKALSPYDPETDDWSAGWILQVLYRKNPENVKNILPDNSSGWFSVSSSVGIDYATLQDDLLAERFQQADYFTSATLRKLAGPEAEKRGYVYFSEVKTMSGIDLVTIDRLWNAYSQGRFGFSVQSKLLDTLNGRYDRLWPRIGWKIDGIWTRYPTAFSWSIEAPEGHMPLINQLRGVRLMDALLKHPDLISRCKS